MLRKVFLVEDETVIREGLRDRIPWDPFGSRFAGEADAGGGRASRRGAGRPARPRRAAIWAKAVAMALDCSVGAVRGKSARARVWRRLHHSR